MLMCLINISIISISFLIVVKLGVIFVDSFVVLKVE